MTDLKPGWERVSFGEVVRLVRETCKDPIAEGIERVIGLEHLEPGDLRVRSWGAATEGTTFTSRVRPGQVLFGKRRAYQRKVAVADCDAVCSGDIYLFESANPERLLPALLPFICQTDDFFEHAVGTSAGSLSPRTNWTSLAAYNFALPPLTEQFRAARALTAARNAGESVNEVRQAARILTSALVEDRLAKFRRDHPQVQVTSLLSRLTVGIVVKPASWYTKGSEGIPALRSLNVSPGSLVLDDLVHITREGHDFHQKSQLRGGDVAIVRTGRPGEAAVIPGDAGPMNCIDLIVTTPGELLMPEYFVLLLNSAFGKQLFASGAAGTAQQHFNVGGFRNFAIPLPPRDVQEAVVLEARSLQDAADAAACRSSLCHSVVREILRELTWQ